MKYKHIFFDWNGTLFDDSYCSFMAVNSMLKNRGLDLITFEQYRDYIDVPIVRFYEKVMDMSKEHMDDLSVEFNSFYNEFLPAKPLPDGLRKLLEQLLELDKKLYIFSSSSNKIIMRYLKQFDLEKYFSCVLGANDCYVTSKINRTFEYIKKLNLNPQKIVFIGDMLHDKDVADFVGADCILMSNGHQSKDKLLSSGNNVISPIDDLYELIC